MSEPFLGEIKMVSFNFAPRGWATCDGQILPISQNQSLYSLIGNTWGGDGRTTFALPDLRGRVPSSCGDYFTLGQRQGMETVIINQETMAQHTHGVLGTSEPGDKFAGSETRSFATSSDTTDLVYGNPVNLSPMNSGIVSSTGEKQAHSNMQPSLVINFCIALQGLFPSRN